MNPARWAAAAAALVSMVVVFALKTYADALILDAYGVAYVPHFFVADAALTICLSAVYGQLMRRNTRLVDTALVALAAAAAAAAPVAAAHGGAWPFATALAVSTLSALAAMIAWNAATGVVSGRAARAFIPRVGAAATGGAVLGGLIASAVVAVFGTGGLGPTAAVLLATLTGLVLWLDGLRATELNRRPSPRRRRPRGDSTTASLVTALAVAAVLEALLAAVIDLGFKSGVAAEYHGDSLGMFFALFYAATNTALLIMQLAIAPRMLSAVSLRYNLAIEPLAIATLAIGWALFPGLVLGGLVRGSEIVGKFGIARPSQEIALSPLGDRARRQWKVLLRGVFSQGGAVVGGTLLVLAGSWMTSSAWLLPATAITLAGLWLVVQLAVGRRYLDTLGSALGMLRLSARDRAGLELDRDGVGKVIELIASERRELADLGREILEQTARDPATLTPHLSHPEPRVRAAVYQQLARSPDARNRAALARAALAEPDHARDAVAAAFDALAAHADRCAIERARRHIVREPLGRAIDVDADDAISAWSYLAMIGDLDGDADALERGLDTLLAVDGTRAAALFRVALERGRLDGDAADAAVIAAIETEDPVVRANGLRAAAALGRSKPLVQLLKALELPVAGAEEAIAQLDGAGLGRLAMLAGARQASANVSKRLVRGLRANHGEAAAALAVRYLSHEDVAVRDVATHTLARHLNEYGNRVDDRLLERALAEHLDRFELYVRARWVERKRTSSMVFRHDLATNADVFFVDELERRTETSLSRLCGVLALLGNPAKVHAAERALLAPTLRNRRGGVDILQEVASGTHRLRLFDLLERFLSPATKRDPDATAAVCKADPWLARCASAELRPLQYMLWALRTNQLFDRLEGDALVALAESVVEERHDAGVVVAREDEVGEALWLVVEGSLELTCKGLPAGHVRGGQAFGELSLVDGGAPGVTATTTPRTRLLRLPREAFDRSRARHREIGLGLVRGLAASLRRANISNITNASQIARVGDGVDKATKSPGKPALSPDS